MTISSPGIFVFARGGKLKHWVKLGWHWRAGGDVDEVIHLETGACGFQVSL